MRRWLGLGAVLVVLGLTLWYALGAKESGPAHDSTADGTSPQSEQAPAWRSRPVNALLSMPLPAPRGSLHITGTVLGPEGNPVAGAVVVATAPTPNETLSELPCQCDNHCGMKLLQCGCGMAAGQLVALVAERRGEAPPLARTTSDAEGRFALEGLEAGRHALWADGSFGTALQQNVEAGTEGVELRVRHGLTLSGHITDEDGQSVAGALVTALFVEHSRFFDTLSDAEGRWRLGPLPEGDYNLVFAKTGLMPEHAKVRSASDREQEVTLLRPLRLIGQVQRDGQPVVGAQVHAEGEHRKLDTSTDAKGHFSFEGLRPGDYEVSATNAEQVASGEAQLSVGMEASELLLELGAGVRVTGTVRDRAGQPIPDATVYLSPSSRHGEEARTAADGTYALGPLPSKRYTFQVKARHYVPSPRLHRLVEGATTLDFTLDAAALIQGRVLSPSGQPLEGADLVLLDVTEGERPMQVGRGQSEPPEGMFELDVPKPGSYRLQVRHDDFAPTTHDLQAPASGVQVVLQAGAKVMGEVVDEKGAPVPRAMAMLLPEHGQLDDLEQASTDEQGRFTFKGLGPGKYVVSAREGTGAEARLTSRSVDIRGTEPARVRLQLSEGLPLAGIVVDGSGTPIPEARLYIRRMVAREVEEELDGLEREHLYDTRGPRTGADGRFQVRHLKAGKYLVSASKEGHAFDWAANGLGGADTEEHFPGIEALAGATDVRVVLRKLSHIRGRVVRADGTPVTRFALNDTDVVDPKGAFAEPIIESGEQTLLFTAPRLAPTSRKVQATKGVDLELGDVVLATGRTVRGRVVDAASGAPVAGALVDVSDEPADSKRPVHVQEKVGQERTTSNGSFILPNVDDGPLTLAVVHPEYVQTRLELAPGQTNVTVRLDAGATLRGTIRATGAHMVGADLMSLNGGYTKSANSSGSTYELRGLRAGTYVIHPWAIARSGEPPTLHPRQVELPATGVVTLDFEEARSGATLRPRLVGGSGSTDVVYYLVPGKVAMPDSPEAFLRMRALASQGVPETESASAFYALPEGPYTLFLLRDASKGFELHREELELPAEGEVSPAISPRWERHPEATRGFPD